MGTNTIHRTETSIVVKKRRKNGKGGTTVRAICTHRTCGWEYENHSRSTVDLVAAKHEYDSAIAAGNVRTARREGVLA